MNIPKTTSVALLTLALTSFSVPTAGPALAQSEGLPPGACAVQSDQAVPLMVGLSGKFSSIQEALDYATECQFTGDLNIVVDADAPNKALPQTIPAGFKSVSISGANQQSDKSANVELTQAVVNGNRVATKVYSTLFLHHVRVEVANKLLDARAVVTVDDSSFSGSGVLIHAAQLTNNSSRITITDSTFTNVAMAHIVGGVERVEIDNNQVTMDGSQSAPILSLGRTKFDSTVARIERNSFSVTGGAGHSPMLSIARPNVSVSLNTFTTGLASVPGIEILVPSSFGTELHQVPSNIRVRTNVFNLPSPIVNSTGSARRSDDLFNEALNGDTKIVTFQNNNVATALSPEIRLTGELFQTNNYLESCNYWGSKGAGIGVATPERMVLKEWPEGNLQQVDFEPLCVPAKDLLQTNPGAVPTPPITQPNSPSTPAPAPAPIPAPAPAPGPQVGPAGQGPMKRFGSHTRFETAVAISQAQYPKADAKAVILARADVAADSVSAVPLAKVIDAPVLLTQPNELHHATKEEIKRLMPSGGKIVIMGGPVAVSQAVEDGLVKDGYTIERVAGANRAATAVVTAERLDKQGKAKQVLLVDGTDWQPDLIAGPAAAKVDGVTLLTNGDQAAEETKAYLNAHAHVKVTAIGEKAKQAGGASANVIAADPAALSVAVANQFFGANTVKAVGFATTATFADALAGGAHAAKYDAPLLLMPAQTPVVITDWVKANTELKDLYIYGGPKAISEEQIEALNK